MAMSGIVDPGLAAPLARWLWGGAVAALLGAGFVAVVESRGGRPGRRSIGIAAFASGLIALLGLVLVLDGAPFAAAFGSVLTLSTVDVRYDGLSGVFLVALGAVGLASSLAAMDGVAHEPGNAVTGAAYPVFLLSLLLVFGAADAFAFLLAWEVMAISSAALVIGARPTLDQVRAGYLYLAVTHLATAALLVAFALLTAQASGRMAFADWRLVAPGLPSLERDAVFALLFVGFATKAGAIPFHVWLPRAHPVAPAHVSALMSGVMIKTGVYGLVRLGFDVLGVGPDWWGGLLIGIGAVSAILGVLYALMEHDLKRLLAFHSIENIGIILLGLGAAMVLRAHGLASLAALGLVAALFHSVNHGLFKGLLFLGAGAVQHAAGGRDLNRLGGLVRVMPVTALCFGIGAAAISGLPPLNGFASEWLTFQALIGAGAGAGIPPIARSLAFLAVGGLALTAALAVACFVKATGMTFLALPRSHGAETAHEAGPGERWGMAILAVLCVGAGLAAGPITTRLTALAGSLVGDGAVQLPATVATLPGEAGSAGSIAPFFLAALATAASAAAFAAARIGRAHVVTRRAPTWACGIVADSSMEYTATSYSKPIRLFFRQVLLPDREVHVEYHPGSPVPRSITYRGEVTHVLEAMVFGPMHALSVRGAHSVRRLQNGSLQAYLAYTLGALLVLLAISRWTS